MVRKLEPVPIKDLKNFNPNKLPRGWRLTYHKRKWWMVPPGYNVYLGWQVKDRGSKGFDKIMEVEDTLKQILEDYHRGRKDFGEGWARKMLNQRTKRLALIVKRDRDFEGVRRECLKRINSFRRKFGMKAAF